MTATYLHTAIQYADMVTSKQSTMTDRRALLTDREREIISGDADVSDSYRYQTISRIRARFDRLAGDLQALESHGALADELRDEICPTDTVDGHTHPPRDGRELVETDDDRDETHTSGADSGAVDAPQDDARLDETLSERATDAVDEIDAAVGLEGDGLDWERRRDAVVHLYEHLRRHEGERFRKSQLQDVLEADGVPTGYAVFASLWKKWVTGSGDRPNLLASFPGVEQRGNGYVFERELVDA